MHLLFIMTILRSRSMVYIFLTQLELNDACRHVSKSLLYSTNMDNLPCVILKTSLTNAYNIFHKYIVPKMFSKMLLQSSVIPLNGR